MCHESLSVWDAALCSRRRAMFALHIEWGEEGHKAPLMGLFDPWQSRECIFGYNAMCDGRVHPPQTCVEGGL